jgi:hypothetical protein
MDDLIPHPLVAGIDASFQSGLVRGHVVGMQVAAVALAAELAPGAAAQSDLLTGKSRHTPAAAQAAGSHAASTHPTELVTFAGYLGERVSYPDTGHDGVYPGLRGVPINVTDPWRILYLDSRLSSWIVVKEHDVVFADRAKDETAALGLRDVIWVRSHAVICRGGGLEPLQQLFLRGQFTRAADFDAPPSGGTFGSTTGVFCEAHGPGTCKRHSYA